jgi:uncharacterized lipoprotein YddW (UPF0748 family)
MLSPSLLAACIALFTLLVSPVLTFAATEPTPALPLPSVRREFRGVWITTVSNIDWPSRANLTTEEQKAELIDLLDRARALNLNAVILQVRPAGDAFYRSDIEPWSENLTGQMGRAPEPFYDPLEFAITEAHRRGLELHAWFNPYRVKMPPANVAVAPEPISRRRPDLVKPYARYLWLDPGETEVQDYTTRIVLDVVRRYDIDGVHFDDYFYPYPQRDADKQLIPFPDDPSWNRYREKGGTLTRPDWRRENVNSLIQRLYREVKAAKPWVKFGISPFGIWRSGQPAQIRGLDAYEEIFADSRKWLVEGWVDYLMPQLYWPIETPGQSFPVLLNWWTQQNPQGRHIWPGLYTSRAVGKAETRWAPQEIEYQIRITRGHAKASGNAHFNAQGLLQKDEQGLTKHLAQSVYSHVALIPASPWMGTALPASPQATTLSAGRTVTWRAGNDTPVRIWVVQYRSGTRWASALVPGHQNSYAIPAGEGTAAIDEVAVSAVDRLGNQGPAERVSA